MPLGWVNRDGKLLIFARACRLFAQGSVSVFLAIYLRSLGFSLVQIGFFISTGVTGSLLLSVIVGLFADVVGRRTLLVVFSALRGVAGTALVLTNNYPLLLVISFLTGFAGGGGGGGAIQPLGQATLAGTAPPQRRNDLYAIYNILATAGSALGALAAGLPPILQGSFGIGELASYRVMLVSYAFFNFLAAFLSAILSAKIEAESGSRRWVNPFTLPSRRRIFTLAGVFSVDAFAQSMLIQSLVALWFFDHYHLKLGVLALNFFASSLLGASSVWFGAKLANRFGLINTMVFTRLPANLFLIALPFMPTAWLAVLCWQINALSQSMASSVRQSYTMAIVTPQERVTMATVSSVENGTFIIISPSIITYLWTVAQASIPFVIAGTARLSHDIALYLLFRNVRPPEEMVRKGVGRGKGQAESARE